MTTPTLVHGMSPNVPLCHRILEMWEAPDIYTWEAQNGNEEF